MTVNVPLPPGTRAKNLDVVMTPKKLKVELRSILQLTAGPSQGRARADPRGRAFRGHYLRRLVVDHWCVRRCSSTDAQTTVS